MGEATTNNHSAESAAKNSELTSDKSIESNSEESDLSDLSGLTEKQKEIREKLLGIIDELKESFRTYESDFFEGRFGNGEENNIECLKSFLESENSEDIKIVLNFSQENGMTILHDVAEFYDGITELLLGAGADPDITDKDGKTPLQIAIDYRCYGAVSLFFDEKLKRLPDEQKKLHNELHGLLDDINYVSDRERFDSEYNVDNDKIAALKEFLDYHKKENSEDLKCVLNLPKGKFGSTVLHDIQSPFYTETSNLLLEAGADPNVKDIEGKTPLHYAADFNYTEIVEVLLNGGANPNKKDKNKCTPLHSAVNSNACDSASAIIEAGADLDVPDGNGQTPLLIAAICDREDTAKRLLEKGAKYNTKDNEGNTAIYYAVKQGLIGIVECLMEKDDIDLDTLHVYEHTPEYGVLKESPLHSAVALSIKSGKIAELLLRKGSIDVNIDDKRGNTPLLIAAGSGRNSTVELLIQKGAKTNSENNKKNNVFHFAAGNDYIDKFSMPSSSGKSKNDIASVGWLYDVEQAKNSKSVEDPNPGMIINSIIAEIRQEERKKGSNDNQIIQTVLESINARNQDGNTPIFFAIERGNRDVIETLLKEGAAVTVKDKNGYTPFHYAIKSKSPKILKSLLLPPVECGEIINCIQDALTQYNSPHYTCELEKQFACFEIAMNITKELSISISCKEKKEALTDEKIENLFPAYIKENKEVYETIKKYVSEIIESVVKTTKERLNVLDEEGNTLLHHAVKWGCSEEILGFLVRSGVDINAKNKHGVAPIHIAAKYGKASQMDFFIRNGADLNAQCGNFTKVETEILENNLITVQDGNMDASSVVSIKNNTIYESTTPTFIAADNLNTNAVHMLTSEEANSNIPNKIGATPLHVVAARILNRDYKEQEKGEVYGIFQRLVLSSTNDLLWCKKFIEIFNGDEKEKEELKKVIDNIIEDSKIPTDPVEESAPAFDENFYDVLGSHVNKVPDLYLDTAYNKLNGLNGSRYGLDEWDLQGDHLDLQPQYADKWVEANVRTEEERAGILGIEESAWGKEGNIPKASSTDVWDSAPQKGLNSWIDAGDISKASSTDVSNSDPQNDVNSQINADKNDKVKGNELKEEAITDINQQGPNTTLADASVQEVGVEERSHLDQTKLIKREELKLNKFLNKVSKAQNMLELYQIVDEALKAGVRINCAQNNNDTFANVVLFKACQLKLDPKIASGIVCKLVSKGAVFGESYNKINYELKKSEIFEDHEVNLQKANKEFCKRIDKFYEVVESAISHGELYNLEIDNATFHLEYSEDSVVDVTKVVKGAESLGASGGGIVKVGENEVEIEINDGIKNYANLSCNGCVILTLKGLEITLYHDKQNKDRVIVEVSDNDRNKLNELSDKEKNQSWGNYQLGGLSVCDAIKQGYFERSDSGKLQASETISPSVQGKVGEIIKSLDSSDITTHSLVNSLVSGVQLSKIATEQGKSRA